jgi:thymidine phosphorylase
MDQPLGWAVGNAVELREVRDMLEGGASPPDLFSLAVQAAGRLLALSDLGIDVDEGMRRAEASIEDGSALAAFERWIAAQGGDPSPEVLPTAPVVRELTAERDGFVGAVGAMGVGRVALDLGAGRRTKDDEIDHAVGIRRLAKRGDAVETGQVLAEVHARDEESATRAVEALRGTITFVDDPPPARPIVLETLG